tara:strand:- start:1544 stop:1792 length:249 start_codon:yes stop_codon:yes gene_type:complete
MKDQIKEKLLEYVFQQSDLDNKMEIPLNESLLATGVLDSFGIVELIEYIESTWEIIIDDSDFTVEKMGSITKMVNLIDSKLN